MNTKRSRFTPLKGTVALMFGLLAALGMLAAPLAASAATTSHVNPAGIVKPKYYCYYENYWIGSDYAYYYVCA